VAFPDSSDAMLEDIVSDMGQASEQIFSSQFSAKGSSSLKAATD
jgi:hypothetical protein